MTTPTLLQERDEARQKLETMAAVTDVLTRECGEQKTQLREIEAVLQHALYPDGKRPEMETVVNLAREAAQIVELARGAKKEPAPC